MSRRKASDNLDESDSGDYYDATDMKRFRGANPQKAKPMNSPIPGGQPGYETSDQPLHVKSLKDGPFK